MENKEKTQRPGGPYNTLRHRNNIDKQTTEKREIYKVCDQGGKMSYRLLAEVVKRKKIRARKFSPWF